MYFNCQQFIIYLLFQSKNYLILDYLLKLYIEDFYYSIIFEKQEELYFLKNLIKILMDYIE